MAGKGFEWLMSEAEKKKYAGIEFGAEIANFIQLYGVDSTSSVIWIDVTQASKSDLELGEFIYNNFWTAKNSFETVLRMHHHKKQIRFHNFPDNKISSIRKLRANSKDFIVVLGYIKKLSKVIFSIKETTYKCSKCGAEIIQQSFYGKCYRPQECVTDKCTNKTFVQVSTIKTDIQKVLVEEALEDPNLEPRSMLVVLEGDLCDPMIDDQLALSKKVKISGFIRTTKKMPWEAELKEFLEAHSIDVIDDSFTNAKFEEVEIEQFLKVSKQDQLLNKFSESIFPHIYGHDLAKKAITLQLFGGNSIFSNKMLRERGNLHVMLCAQPGTAKTMFLKTATLFSPKSRLTGGKLSSGVGLVATVTKDKEFGWALEAGPVATCSDGLVALDEIDKISKEDIAFLNNAMVDLKVFIDKANVHKVLQTRTSILAASNPKDRVFDKREARWKQIPFPKDFMDRFDLIIVLERDAKDEAALINKMINIYDIEKYDTPFDPEFIKRYIMYSRLRIYPKVPSETANYIEENYKRIFKPNEEENAMPSHRLLASIFRLAQASAKVRLSEIVSLEDAEIAVNLVIGSLRSMDIINPQGLVDIERMEAITPQKIRDKGYTIRAIIRELSNKSANHLADYNEIIREAAFKEIEPDECDKLMDKLSRSGDIIEQRRGWYKLV